MGETRTLITGNLSNGCGGIPANQKIWRNTSINYTPRRHDSPLANFSTPGPIKLAAAIQLPSRTTAGVTFNLKSSCRNSRAACAKISARPCAAAR